MSTEGVQEMTPEEARRASRAVVARPAVGYAAVAAFSFWLGWWVVGLAALVVGVVGTAWVWSLVRRGAEEARRAAASGDASPEEP